MKITTSGFKVTTQARPPHVSDGAPVDDGLIDAVVCILDRILAAPAAQLGTTLRSLAVDVRRSRHRNVLERGLAAALTAAEHAA